MLLTVVVWMRNVFGVVVVLAWGLALVTMARRRMANALRFLLSLLAVQVALNSVYDNPRAVPGQRTVRCGDHGRLFCCRRGSGGDVDADERRDALVDVVEHRAAASRESIDAPARAHGRRSARSLLFSVQPLIAKQIVPWFGGTSAVWTLCWCSFQSLLTAGYAYSDWTTRKLGTRSQAALTLALLALS
jgi:hypothetical protein